MKTADLIRLAAKNLRGRWMFFPGIGVAVSIFCLCFAGAVWETVGREKAQPYELAVSAAGGSGLTDSAVAQITKLSHVVAATPLLSVSTTVKTGVYTARLTLTGIDPAYLQAAFSKGGVFPQNSAMPYIVLNAAACQQFSKNLDTGTQAGSGAGKAAGGVTSSAGMGSQTPIGSNTAGAGSSAGTGTVSGTGSNTGAQTGAWSSAADAGSGAGTTASSIAAAKTQAGTVTGTAAGTGAGTTAGTGAPSSAAGGETDAAAASGAGSGDGSDADAPKIDWLTAGFAVQAGGNGQWIPSKVCGLTAGSAKGQQAAAYISLSTAKSLLYKSGQSTDYAGAKVRVTDSGYADSVSRAIAALGLQVTNPNTALQAKWDGESKEMAYLTVIGAFGLLCSAVLLAVWEKSSLQGQKETWELLRWLGIRKRDAHALFLMQSVLISLAGIAVGVATAVSLPSFLPPALQGTSIYALPIPFETILVNIAVCTAAAALPCLLPYKGMLEG